MEAVADVAVLVTVGSHGAIVELVGIPRIAVQPRILVPLIVIPLPGNVVRQQNVSNAVLRGSGNRERSVIRIMIRIRIGSVAEVSGVVIVQQVVVSWIAIGLDRWLQGTQILKYRTDAGLCGIRTVAVGTAAINPGG